MVFAKYIIIFVIVTPFSFYSHAGEFDGLAEFDCNYESEVRSLDCYSPDCANKNPRYLF